MISNTQTNELRTIYQADRGAQKKMEFQEQNKYNLQGYTDHFKNVQY